MSKKRKHPEKSERTTRVARKVKRRLIFLIAFLIVILFAMLLGAGKDLWPFWMAEHRTQIEGLIVLAIVCLIVLSPVIIEATSNPRVLSGPGKNPKGPPLG